MGAVARHELAAAVSEAGGLGTIGGARGQQVNAQPSLVAFSRRGAPLAVFAILLALAASAILPTAL